MFGKRRNASPGTAPGALWAPRSPEKRSGAFGCVPRAFEGGRTGSRRGLVSTVDEARDRAHGPRRTAILSKIYAEFYRERAARRFEKR
ncbi:hypothetical protein HMPREF9440_02103 [Sutterella parvirubra YIT 11816]|uniref:Uncharacterized protein n=1 Tax=Sutterella parvirubra YIT 11816 TaxID=762967 RepID=H3KH62_9BURK|nr:hypothetical protein HMPREF9440_02103 [Sutterella parvirubra YIT 11816]